MKNLIIKNKITLAIYGVISFLVFLVGCLMFSYYISTCIVQGRYALNTIYPSQVILTIIGLALLVAGAWALSLCKLFVEKYKVKNK